MGVAFVKNQSATTEKGAVTGNNLLADSQFNYKDPPIPHPPLPSRHTPPPHTPAHVKAVTCDPEQPTYVIARTWRLALDVEKHAGDLMMNILNMYTHIFKRD